MFVVDTNVLVYAADTSALEHDRCRALLTKWREDNAAWFLTWGICYEFLRVVTHPRILRRPWTSEAASGFLEAVWRSRSVGFLVPTDRHRAVLHDVTREVPAIAGNLWHDAETASLMREHGIRRICTRDTDFHRFSFVEVIDPVNAEP
ncbi:MAG TPA: TA system VapC family ribonuclease toxin [Gemmatimonadaceae bacterium]